MAKSEQGCFGCWHASWDADGCTCKITGLLAGNPVSGCENRTPEAERKASEAWCENCEHIEMCKWYPFCGCEFRGLTKPAEPETAQWLHRRVNGYNVRECSRCGKQVQYVSNFCPDCGRKMTEVKQQ